MRVITAKLLPVGANSTAITTRQWFGNKRGTTHVTHSPEAHGKHTADDVAFTVLDTVPWEQDEQDEEPDDDA
jgi:hypothetical protein